VSVEISVYQLRPSWHPRYQADVYVPADLRALTGPTVGQYDPPVNLYWQPGVVDLTIPGDVDLFYSSAIVAGSYPSEINQWVNRDVLLSRWPGLSLPSRVRGAWESLHPNLRSKDSPLTDRSRIQDSVFNSITRSGSLLAGGSMLLGYDVVTRHGNDMDTCNERLDRGCLVAASQRIFEDCVENYWRAVFIERTHLYTRILVDAGSGFPVIVQIVLESNPSAGQGLRLLFHDIVGEKVATVANVTHGRDFFDLAHILNTPGWTMKSAEDAMSRVGFSDRVNELRTKVGLFREGNFDDEIRRSGFDVRFCHHVLDHD
jgi:hypothetical protein